jgi:DNA-binding GntR family transcriptional regulator
MTTFTIEDRILPLKRETLADRVHEDLKDLLLSGALLPGERLTLGRLAKAVGTSSMPVRDAVSRLAAEKALEVRPNRSVLVPSLGRERLEEITSIRCVLEGFAAGVAAEHATATEIDEIAGYARDFEIFGRRPNPDVGAAIKRNRLLHFAVYRASRMVALVEMIESVWLRVGPFFTLTMSNKIRRLSDIEAFDHHRRLVSAMRERNPEIARDAVVRDIREAFDGLVQAGVFEGYKPPNIQPPGPVRL